MEKAVLGALVLAWVACTVAAPGDAWADLLCKGPSGAVHVRSSCKAKETALDPAVLSAAFAALQTEVAGHDAVLAPFSVTDGGSAVELTGVNLRLVDGSGRTTGPPNGRGNLIIGYDEGRCHGDPGEERPCQTDPDCATIGGPCDHGQKTGSHNLVIGPGHQYPGIGGLVSGSTNTIAGAHQGIVGGFQNSATGDSAGILGGADDVASGGNGAICGGHDNDASGPFAAVLGGFGNAATGDSTTVAGGSDNGAHGEASLVLGGESNGALGEWATVVGGLENGAPDSHEVVIGTTP
jgi:hypothetical protein